MTDPPTEMRVTSHVGRDVLAQAAQFKTEASAVWEYVVNSLQYVDTGTQPKVEVTVKHNSVVISDNGCGMNADRLQHFFTMHGENLERRAGRIGRGKWGTGKSAAFGIAAELQVDTIRNGIRNVVQLTRSAIDSSSGADIPLEWKVRNEEVAAENGTVVSMNGILLSRIDKAAIIEYIERGLSAFRGMAPTVAVNSHVCEYHEPPIQKTHQFRPSPKQAETLGHVELTIKASKTPLREWDQGVAVLAGVGNLVAIERGGVEHKEFGNYLFGEIEVPALETYETPLEAFDGSRSLTLNPRHPVVAVLVGFIGSKLEQVRQEMVSEHKSAREEEEARRLAKQADALADLLNEDFRTQINRLRDIRAATSRPGAASGGFGSTGQGDAETDFWVAGMDEPGEIDPSASDVQSREENSDGRPAPIIPQVGAPASDGQSVVSPAGGSGRRPRPRGGFSVDFRELGTDEDRSLYDATSMTIIINLDHPVVAAALSRDGIESTSFRRLSYEIAFSEYAIALSYEMVNRDPAMPADDVLYDIRSTLKRITRAAAPLYA
jgi:Histidine kinase-, DNA gyrase B-, and HSP90-like ATPase